MAEDNNNSFGTMDGGDLFSTAIAGTFNIASGFLNNYFGKKVSKKEYQRAIELWNMQNEYNKPINQMARLREAGLNPNLVAGSLSNSVAGAIHAPSKENLSSPLEGLDLVGTYQNLRQKDAMTQQIDAQTKQIDQQTKATKQAGIRTKLENTLLALEINEHLNKGTSRGTPVVERNFRGLMTIGEDIGKLLADLVVDRDLEKTLPNYVKGAGSSAYKGGFEHAVPFYGAYNKLRSYFK